MKVLQIHKFFWKRDGASNYFFYLSELLTRSQNEVVVFSMQNKNNLNSPYKKFFVSGIDLSDPKKLSFIEKLKGVGRIFYSFEARKKIKELIEKEKPDIVHLHNIYHHISPSILGVIKKHKIPIVMTLHDYKLLSPNYSLFHHGEVHEEDAKGWHLTCVKNKCHKNSRIQSILVTLEMIFHNKIMHVYKKNVDKFIAPSKFMKHKCVEFGWPAEKFVQIPNPIDVDKFKPSKKDGSYVAYVGRISEEKGVLYFVEAAMLNPQIDFKVVGDGPTLDEIKKYVQEKAIKNVEFTGFKTGKALQDLIKGARILVVPSIWYENYPLSVLEAKATGKIVIGFKIGGITEMLPESMLAPVKDVKELALKIKYWFNKSLEERKEIGLEFRKEVLKRNNPKSHIKKILKLYKELLPVKDEKK